MNRQLESHPDDNLLAGFVDGRLEGQSLAAVAAHVESCRECLEIVGDAAAIGREAGEAPAAPVPGAVVRQFPSRWVPLAAAAALVVVAGIAGWSLWRGRGSDPASPLLAAMEGARERPVEARISGAAYAPFVVVRGEGTEPDPEGLRLAAAAGQVLEDSSGRGRVADQHAAGLAALLSGDTARAERHLERATSLDGSQARYWSDLAAARYEQGRSTGDRRRLSLALVAAGRALRVAPEDPAALFNRALILEALGRESEAVPAWERVLRADPGSPWAAEAERRSRRLRDRPR